MTSIFDTEEDFNFSDDDLLVIDLFSKTEEKIVSSTAKRNECHPENWNLSGTPPDSILSNVKIGKLEKREASQSRESCFNVEDKSDNFNTRFKEASSKFNDRDYVDANELSSENENHTNVPQGYKFYSKNDRGGKQGPRICGFTGRGRSLVTTMKKGAVNRDSVSVGDGIEKYNEKSGIRIGENVTDSSFVNRHKSDNVSKFSQNFGHPREESVCTKGFSTEPSAEFSASFLHTSNDRQNEYIAYRSTAEDVEMSAEERISVESPSLNLLDSIKTSKKRKFPGPAGFLPKLHSTDLLDDTKTSCDKPSRRRMKSPKIVNSPGKLIAKEDDDFSKPFWLELQREALSKFKGYIYHSISMTLKKFGIEFLQPSGFPAIPIDSSCDQQQDAYTNKLDNGKVPLMCALIKTFTANGSDASVILKDPTGEIHGTIHKAVLENYQTGLCAGSGIILKQVSIFSPTPRRHYVNITPSNIMFLVAGDSASIASRLQPKQNSDASPKHLVENKLQSEEIARRQEEDFNELIPEDEDFDSWIDDSEDCFAELIS